MVTVFLDYKKKKRRLRRRGKQQKKNVYTGCAKSSFLYFISLYFSTIGLGRQIISTKVVSFNIVHYFYTFCTIFWLQYSICVLPRQRCPCASRFSSHIFLVFHNPNCSISFLVFVNITKDKPPQRKNVQLRERISLYTSIYWLICCRNC